MPVQGTAQLYQSLQTKLKQQLQAFEQYAAETCLHIPAGLMPSEVNQGFLLCYMSCVQSNAKLSTQLRQLRLPCYR